MEAVLKRNGTHSYTRRETGLVTAMNLINRWRKNNADNLAGEIEVHIEIEAQQNMAAGMSADEARYAAIRKFGNVSLAKEQSRKAWG